MNNYQVQISDLQRQLMTLRARIEILEQEASKPLMDGPLTVVPVIKRGPGRPRKVQQ